MLGSRLDWSRNWMRRGVPVWVALSLLGCTGEREGGQTRDARPGIVQGGSATGQLLDEDFTCERLYDELTSAREELNCGDEVDIPTCPGLIRPGGSIACRLFSQESLEGCQDTIANYDSCGDFESRRCVLVAVLERYTIDCRIPGEGDAGDAGADGGAEAGAPEAGVVDAGQGEPDEREAGTAPAEAGAAEAGAAEPDASIPEQDTDGQTDVEAGVSISPEAGPPAADAAGPG